MQKSEAYKKLDLSPGADEAAVKKAFRQLAKRHHPDSNPDDPLAETRFKEINKAYQILTRKITATANQDFQARSPKQSHSRPETAFLFSLLFKVQDIDEQYETLRSSLALADHFCRKARERYAERHTGLRNLFTRLAGPPDARAARALIKHLRRPGMVGPLGFEIALIKSEIIDLVQGRITGDVHDTACRLQTIQQRVEQHQKIFKHALNVLDGSEPAVRFRARTPEKSL